MMGAIESGVSDMEAVFSPEVMAGLQKARMQDAIKKNRLRVQVGEDTYPVIELWETGFSVLAESTPNLRGLVDLFDSARHLLQCLIIRSEEEAGVVVYEFKRSTTVVETPPKDFAEDENAPVALIGR